MIAYLLISKFSPGRAEWFVTQCPCGCSVDILGMAAGGESPCLSPWIPDHQLVPPALTAELGVGTGPILPPGTRLSLPSYDASTGPFGIGVAAPHSLGERSSSTEPRLGMLNSTCTDRSSCLGKQRYIYFKHSLFLALSAMFPLGDAASSHPDTSRSQSVCWGLWAS